MATFKKKDFKEQYVDSETIEEENIDELINGDGALVGDETKMASSDSEIWTDSPFTGDEEADQGAPTTTDDHVNNTRQKRKYPWGYGYAANGINTVRESEKILAKERMGDLIEDIMSDKSNSNDFVRGNQPQDINRNDIPDITDITTNNQALANSIESAIKMVNAQGIKGESLGVVLNYILSNVDVSSLPQDYKRILKGKI
jgi:hypothetical protein